MTAHEISAIKTFADMFGIGLRQNPVERAGQMGRLCGTAATLLRSAPARARRRPARPGAVMRQADALVAIAALPSLTRRRLIATFGATEWAKLVAKPPRHGDSG
jgi:hypothetical protein